MSDDLQRRVESLESSTKEISMDLKRTTASLQTLTSDINVLVNNVTHLTESIQTMTKIIDRTHHIELDIVELKGRTQTITKLWEQVDILKEKVAAQTPISNAVKIIGATVLTSGIALMFSIISTGGLGS